MPKFGSYRRNVSLIGNSEKVMKKRSSIRKMESGK